MAVVNCAVHITTSEFFQRVAKYPARCGVHESCIALAVYAVDTLTGGIKQQTILMLEFAKDIGYPIPLTQPGVV